MWVLWWKRDTAKGAAAGMAEGVLEAIGTERGKEDEGDEKDEKDEEGEEGEEGEEEAVGAGGLPLWMGSYRLRLRFVWN